MSSNYTEFDVQLINARTKEPIDDDSGLYNVLTASTPTEATIYSNDQGTSASNPGTMTDGRFTFYVASSVTSVDVSILTSTGYSVFVEGLTADQHRVEIDLEKRTNQTFVVPVVFGTGSAAVVDSGFDLIAGMMVKDCYLHCTTVSSANALNVGVSGTTDGFLLNGVLGSTGWKLYQDPIVTTLSDLTGPTMDIFVSATQIRGDLLARWAVGITTTTTGSTKGFFTPKYYSVTAATSLVYAGAVTNTEASGGCYIYIDYDLRPTQGN
jgi:hypothetical protein